MLILRKKFVTDFGVFCQFAEDDTVFILPENEAVSRVEKITADYRNCRVSKGKVCLKSQFGEAAVEDIRYIGERKGKVRLTTKRKNDDKEQFIMFNDNFFLRVLSDRQFIEDNLLLMLKTDGIDFFDKKSQAVKTPFGVCDIRQISTGLKTLLNIKYISEKYKNQSFTVNCDECGHNILEDVFALAAGTRITLFFSRSIEYSDKGFEFVSIGDFVKADLSIKDEYEDCKADLCSVEPIRFSVNQRTYNISFNSSNIVQLSGDSASGKSLFCRDFREWLWIEGKDESVLLIDTVNKNFSEFILYDSIILKYKVVVIDNADVIITDEMNKAIFEHKDIRWIIIGRKAYSFVPKRCIGYLKKNKDNEIIVEYK